MTDAPVTYTVGGPDLAWRETGSEIVVLDVAGSVYFGLNATGAELWKRLAAGGATREELTGMLISGAGATAEQAAPDVDAFLAGLSHYGLLQETPTGDA